MTNREYLRFSIDAMIRNADEHVLTKTRVVGLNNANIKNVKKDATSNIKNVHN